MTEECCETRMTTKYGVTVVSKLIESIVKYPRGKKVCQYYGKCYIEQDDGWWDMTETYRDQTDAKVAMESLALDLAGRYTREQELA